MEFSYYPGCTLTGSAQELDESFRTLPRSLTSPSKRSRTGHAAEHHQPTWWILISNRPSLLETS